LDPDTLWDGEWGRSRDGCIRWGVERRREWVVLDVNLGRPIVTNWDFATRLFPNYYGQDLAFYIEKHDLILLATLHRVRLPTWPRHEIMFS